MQWVEENLDLVYCSTLINFSSTAAYTLYKITCGMEIFYLVNNFQTIQSQFSTEI